MGVHVEDFDSVSISDIQFSISTHGQSHWTIQTGRLGQQHIEKLPIHRDQVKTVIAAVRYNDVQRRIATDSERKKRDSIRTVQLVGDVAESISSPSIYGDHRAL